MKINIHINIHININHPTHTQVFLPVLETCLLRLMLQALHNTGIWQVGNVCTRLRMMIIRYSRSNIIKVNCTFTLCYVKNEWWNKYRNKDVLNNFFSVFLLKLLFYTSFLFFSPIQMFFKILKNLTYLILLRFMTLTVGQQWKSWFFPYSL